MGEELEDKKEQVEESECTVEERCRNSERKLTQETDMKLLLDRGESREEETILVGLLPSALFHLVGKFQKVQRRKQKLAHLVRVKLGNEMWTSTRKGQMKTLWEYVIK